MRSFAESVAKKLISQRKKQKMRAKMEALRIPAEMAAKIQENEPVPAHASVRVATF